MDPAPIYGLGKSECNAPALWVFLYDALINLYKNIANNAEVISPISQTNALINLYRNIANNAEDISPTSQTKSNHQVAAFADNNVVMYFILIHLIYYILLLLQSDEQIWEKLLYSSGGKLEIPKRNFGLFDWTYDNYGRAKMKPSTKAVTHVINSKDKSLMQLP